MRKNKITRDGYIISVGEGPNGEEISDAEYDEILSVIMTVPTPQVGYSYRLKTDLTWEEYEVDPPDPDPELDADEALEILMGGAV